MQFRSGFELESPCTFLHHEHLQTNIVVEQTNLGDRKNSEVDIL